MKLIYIAGPYRPTKIDGVESSTEQNVLRARRVAVDVVNTLGKEGYFPVTPHLNTDNFENRVHVNDDRYFLDGTMAMLERCDAVLLVYPEAPRDSSGTRAEVDRAIELGIPVYGNREQLYADIMARKRKDSGIDQLKRAREAMQAVNALDQRPLKNWVLSSLPHLSHEDLETPLVVTREWYPTAAKLNEVDYGALEQKVLASLPAFPVKALDLRPGDVTDKGLVVEGTNQVFGGQVEVSWCGGGGKKTVSHHTHVFHIVLRKRDDL